MDERGSHDSIPGISGKRPSKPWALPSIATRTFTGLSLSLTGSVALSAPMLLPLASQKWVHTAQLFLRSDTKHATIGHMLAAGSWQLAARSSHCRSSALRCLLCLPPGAPHSAPHATHAVVRDDGGDESSTQWRCVLCDERHDERVLMSAACLLCASPPSSSAPHRPPALALPSSLAMKQHRLMSPVEQQRPSTASAFQYHLQQQSQQSTTDRWSLDSDRSDKDTNTTSLLRSPTHLSHTTPVVHHDALEQVRRSQSSAKAERSSGGERKAKSSRGRTAADAPQRGRREREQESGRLTPVERRREEEEEEGRRSRRQRERRRDDSAQGEERGFSVEWPKDEVEEKQMEHTTPAEARALHSRRSGEPTRRRSKQDEDEERETRSQREARRREKERKETAAAGLPPSRAPPRRSKDVDDTNDSDRRRRRRERKERERQAERERGEGKEQEGQQGQRAEQAEKALPRSWEEELEEQRDHQRASPAHHSERSTLTLAPHVGDSAEPRSPLHHHPRHHSPASIPVNSALHLHPSPPSPRPHASIHSQHSGSHGHSHGPSHPSAAVSNAPHLSHSHHSHSAHPHHPHADPHPGYQTEPIHSHAEREEEKETAQPTASSAVERLLAEVEALRCPACSHHYHTPHSQPPPAPALTPSIFAPTALSATALPQSPTSSTTPSHHHHPHAHHHQQHHGHHHHHHHQHHHDLTSPFSLTSRLPRLLSCSHTFCTSCLTASLFSVSPPSPLLPCPLGCTATLLQSSGQEGVLTLELNEPVISLLQQLKGERRLAHGRSSSSSSSSTVHLDRHLQSDGPVSIFCEQHPTHPLTLYCQDCSMLICLACTSPLFTHADEAKSTAQLDASASVVSAVMSTCLALPTSHRGHRWQKKELVALEWRQSALQSSLLRRVSSEREALHTALGHTNRRVREERERETAAVKAVDDAFSTLQQQLLALLHTHQQQLTCRLRRHHLHTQLHLEGQRRTLATELNDMSLLSVKADWMGQVRSERRLRRRGEVGLDEGGVRVNGLTMAEVVREEEEVEEMRWTSDLLRTIQLERHTRVQVAAEEAEGMEGGEHADRVKVRTDVGEVVDAVREGLQRCCVVVDHVPVTAAFAVARVVEREGRAAEVELRWQASGEDAVTDWQLDVQAARKPMEADRTRNRKSRKQQRKVDDAEEQEEVEPLGLAGLAELHPSSSPSTSSSSAPFLPFYSGPALSCTHPLALDTCYTFRLRAVNAIGPSTYYVYSPPLSAPTLLLPFSYPNDHCGLSQHSPQPLRVLTSTLHPASSPPSQLLHPREGTAVATLPRPSSWVVVDCGVCVVVGWYVMWEGGREEWRRRGMVRWRVWGSVDDREWALIEERGRGEGRKMGEGGVGGGGGRGVGTGRVGWDVRGCNVYGVDVEKSRNEGRGFRYLKWEQVGSNADDDHSLVLGGLELYGRVQLDTHRSA